MKKHIIFILLIGQLLVSCKKDANPAASPDVQDPFARLDNAANPADHQIYLFYKDTGIPVLYSDTVAKSPLFKLNLGYHLTSIDSMVTVKYLHNQADIIAGLNFVKSQITPYLGASVKPYSILLTDSVYTYTNPGFPPLVKTPLNAYLGFNYLAISYVPKISAMDPTQLRFFRKEILKEILLARINSDLTLTTKFYGVSAAYYSKTAYGSAFTPYLIPYAPKEVYGFLTDGTEPPNYYDVPLQAEDLAGYLDKVLLLSPASFVSTYQSYPLVIQKYNSLLDIFKAINFTVPQ